MGYVVDEYLIVSGWNGEHMNSAYDKATRIFNDGQVSAIMPHTVNGTSAFFVNSSGSKRGWSESVEHNERIQDYLSWCKKENLYNEVVHIAVSEETEHSKVKEVITYEERPTNKQEEG